MFAKHSPDDVTGPRFVILVGGNRIDLAKETIARAFRRTIAALGLSESESAKYARRADSHSPGKCYNSVEAEAKKR